MKNYSIKHIKLITKFTFQDFYGAWNNLSGNFWKFIFNKDFLERFFIQKYIPYLEKKWLFNSEIEQRINFALTKIESVTQSINITNNTSFKISDLYFSYQIFTQILWYLNDYYADTGIYISLIKWIAFPCLKNKNVNLDFIDQSFLNKDNIFYLDILYPLLNGYKLFDDTVFVIEFFLPSEVVLALIVSKYIKKDRNKIVLNLSETFEQFDCTQWIDFFKVEGKVFSQYIDFIVLYRDFSQSVDMLLSHLNEEKSTKNINNLWYYENNEFIFFHDSKEKKDVDNIVCSFLENNLNQKNIYQLLGQKFLRSRLTPYMCYYNKCYFCTINSQNILKYNHKYSYEFFIDKWIEFIKQTQLKFLSFKDEAIPPKQIIYFAQKIIENNLDISYQFRTRFDKMYTKDVCKILYTSWARYCWIWLESASVRVNEDIANKGEKDISLKDKANIISYFDSAKIRIQNYSIIWFPTETKIETIYTYNFLVQQIRKCNFYTTSSNMFWLMKWSYIYNNKEKFGIHVDQAFTSNPFHLSFDFDYTNWEKRDIKFYKKIIWQIHMEQALPWLRWYNDIDYSDFRYYIEKSNYFYALKRLNEKNPFQLFENVNKNIESLGLSEKLSLTYSLSPWLMFLNESAFLRCCDYVNHVSFSIDKKYKDFFYHFNDEISLWENCNKFQLHFQADLIDFLLKNRILIYREYEVGV